MKNRTLFLLIQMTLVLSLSLLVIKTGDLFAQTQTSPATATSMNILVNDWAHDKPDSNPGDGQCKTSSNSCTLRAAIQEANASPGADLIFSNYDNSVTFALNSPLPAITSAVTLLGTQEEGEYMHIDGASLPFGTHGLQLMGDHITVKRMVITNFTGSGVWIEGANNVVEESLIGTTYTGASGVGNGDNGITIHSGGYNEIRGNVIAGNGQSGVLIQDGAFNKVLNGNTIGYWPDTYTRLSNGWNGVRVIGGANTLIGGTMAEKNWIAGNLGSGVFIGLSAGSVTVLSNYIGAMQNAQPLGNRNGVEVWGANHTIGNTAQDGNFIIGNTNGVELMGPLAINNKVRFNLIQRESGTANSGDGILLHNSGSNNVIAYNEIGRNGQHGIHVFQTTAGCIYTMINNNLIGTNDVNQNRSNGMDGIHLNTTYCVYIQSNQVAYNQRYGIYLNGTGTDGSNVSMNTCQYNQQAGMRIDTDGNTISTNILSQNPALGLWVVGNSNQLEANSALGSSLPSSQNQVTGIQIDGNSNTLVGYLNSLTPIAYNTGTGLAINGNGNTVKKLYIHSNWGTGLLITGDNNIIGAAGSDRNVVSVNNDGIEITASASGNQIIGNYIGVETSGTGDAGNAIGVRILGSNNQIGGAAANAGNRIGYSQNSNIILSGSGATNNTLEGNDIGPTIGSTSNGILIMDSAADNTIRANHIASSGSAGIYIVSGTGNSLDANTLTLNGSLGIDLAPAGVTLNDTGDNDSGANFLQNFPVITTVTAGADTRIQGALSSKANIPYMLHFYFNTTCDASGYGEGETSMGQAMVTTGTNGQAGFDVTFLVSGALGKYITATATDPDGNTSEFSKCALGRPASTGVAFTVNRTGDEVDMDPNDNKCDTQVTAGDQCSLRAAIQQANASVGADTIILPGGTYNLTLSGIDSTALAGDLDINEGLTLNGAGANVTIIRSQVADRVFEILGSSTVAVNGVTVKGGNLSSAYGAGILVNSGTSLSLDTVSIQENQTSTGSGGGIYSRGTLSLMNSAVISNTAGGETNGGGGLFVLTGVTTLSNTTLSGNQTKGYGGGIQNLAGTVRLNNVTVSNNTADTDNDGGDGGGLYNLSTFEVKNSILAENLDISHGSYAYGIADCAGAYTTQGYNLIGDRARASNYPSTPDGCTGFGGTGANDSVGGNWFMSNYLRWWAGLGSLQLNGGTTLNHSPIASGAGLTVDLGNPAVPGSGGNACEAFDQRGQPRPIDGGTDGIARCDRGAVEHVPSFLSIGDATVTEGTTANFVVTLSEPAQITFTVHYSTTGITAADGQDYAHTAGTLTFGTGQTTKTIPVSTVTDTRDEDAETFRVRLYLPTYVMIADGEGIGTINDGSALPALFINNQTVTEGDSGSSAQMLFSVTLNSASGKTVTVNYATANGTATAGDDYLDTGGQLSFAPGITTQNVIVNVIGDNLREGNEVFNVVLSAPANASLGDATGQGTITDDDVPALSITDSSIFEGDSGTGNMYFTVRLSKPSTQQVMVNFVTSPGTASAPSDYTHTSGALTFTAGETLKTIKVDYKGDTDPESHETFTMTLSSPTGGAIINDGSATGTILDDDTTHFTIYLPLTQSN